MKDKLAAFESLCRREYPAVVRTAYLITGDREEAVDVAQEAFARAYLRWRQVSRLDRPAAWLQRVAANLSISWQRRRRYEDRVSGLFERPDEDPSPDEALMVMEALLLLTPAQRAAVVLRHYADQSVEQTARALGKRPGTIRALTSQGVARLREFLGDTETEEETASDRH
ncbi:MAG TPA: SigE family RNA polymerase sigma factor [Actinomycetota bacterium]